MGITNPETLQMLHECIQEEYAEQWAKEAYYDHIAACSPSSVHFQAEGYLPIKEEKLQLIQNDELWLKALINLSVQQRLSLLSNKDSGSTVIPSCAETGSKNFLFPSFGYVSPAEFMHYDWDTLTEDIYQQAVGQ